MLGPIQYMPWRILNGPIKMFRCMAKDLWRCFPVRALCNSAAVARKSPYHIVDRWKIGGEGGWDYMLADGPAHRLYLAHGPRVDVVDTATGKPVGSITGLYGTHGIALDTSGKFGYVSDGGGNAVVVFDRATLEKVAAIPAGTNPDGIVFEPATQTVWAFNGRSECNGDRRGVAKGCGDHCASR